RNVADWNAPIPRRTAAMPRLTRCGLRTPARRRLVAAARTSPPKVSGDKPGIALVTGRMFFRATAPCFSNPEGSCGRAVGRGVTVTFRGSMRTSRRPTWGSGGAGFAFDSTGRGLGRVTGIGWRVEEAGTFGEAEIGFGTGGALGFTAAGRLIPGISRRTAEGDVDILGGAGEVTAGLSGETRLTLVSGGSFSDSRRKSSTFASVPSGAGTFGAGTGALGAAATTGFVARSRRDSPQIAHSTRSGSLSATQPGQRPRSR